jgi:glycosyltransferase involved in cell wall biosynthesis
MSTLVFIPAWNEADSVAAVIAGVRERLPDADVLVVDDGSTDATAARARAAGATVASLPFNQGLGAALQTGYLYALREGYGYCAHLDADGQHPPAEVARLLEEVYAGRADLVIGSRYRERRALDGGGGDEAGARAGGSEPAGEAGAGPEVDADYKPTISRRIGTGVFRFFLTLATRQRFTDTTSGMRAANRRVMELFSENYSPDFAEIESLQLAVREGLRVEEVPVRMLERAGGSSFLTPLRSAVFIFKGLIVLLVGQFRPRRAGRGDGAAAGASEASSGRDEAAPGGEGAAALRRARAER